MAIGLLMSGLFALITSVNGDLDEDTLSTTASVSHNSFEGLRGKYFSFLRTLFHKCHLTLSFFLRTMHLPYFKSSDKLKWDRKEVIYRSLGSLSSDVFERRTSTGSEVFSLLTCLDDIKFVFLSFFTVIEAI